MSYHINKNGKPALCRATKRPCPYGGADGKENHFDSKEEAQRFADEQNEKEFGLIAKPQQKPIKNRKQFIEAVYEGPVQIDDNLYYRIVKLNENEVNMSDQFKEQLKKEGLYNNSYVSVLSYTHEKDNPAKMEDLPIYGSPTRYVTKHLTYNKEDAIKKDLAERSRGLLKRAVAFHEKSQEQ